jgi:hypothetical protein
VRKVFLGISRKTTCSCEKKTSMPDKSIEAKQLASRFRLFLTGCSSAEPASASPDEHIVPDRKDRSKPQETLTVRSLKLNFKGKMQKITKKRSIAMAPPIVQSEVPDPRNRSIGGEKWGGQCPQSRNIKVDRPPAMLNIKVQNPTAP